jgi:HlyD family secretion protein
LLCGDDDATGTELIQKMKTLCPRIIAIVFSIIDKFQYVKQAFEVRSKKYITHKNISREGHDDPSVGKLHNMKHLSKKIVFVVVLGLITITIVVWYFYQVERPTISYDVAEVKRGDVVITISATGTVEPEEVIDVGAQVAGRIIAFGKDEKGNAIDYGSVVDEGMVLAKIDDSLYADDVAVAAAQLQQSEAKLDQAERDWGRAQKLGPSEALAESSYDAYKYAYDIAKANVAFADATLTRAKQNLDYCTIKSPVKGVIIDRRVNIGQTVVSSLNAPSLFLIAKDLKRMQVWVSVNETDIGNIHSGQPVSFTVDAFPNEVFRGDVRKIRLNATMTQNVVTYTVEVITDNSSGKLLPYLTANVQFEVSRSNNVLLVPNTALRWSPTSQEVSAEFRKAFNRSKTQSENSENNRLSSPKSATGAAVNSVVWVQQGDYVRPVKVRLGLSDGINTEVKGDEVKEGLLVVIGEKRQPKGDISTTNPFVPQIRGSRK